MDTFTITGNCGNSEISSISEFKNRIKFTSQRDGQYIIQSIMSLTDGGDCNILPIGGLLRVYAVKFALEQINNDHRLLPNVTLGFQFDDACLSLPITMERGIEIANIQRKQNCYITNHGVCNISLIRQKPISAVIGAFFSFTTIPLASLLGVYNIPIISFGASSPLLNKQESYQSFFRTIPSDASQTEAIVDILKYFNWTYVFLIGSDDDYGRLGLEAFKKLAPDNSICVTGNFYIPFGTSTTEIISKDIALKLQQTPKATVVIMFNYAKGMGEYVLKEADNLNLTRTWLTSEAWNPEIFETEDIPKKQMESVITVSLKNGKSLPKFKSYLQNVINKEYSCDMWLHTFIKQHFECEISSIINETLYGKLCSSNNTCELCTVLSEDVVQSIFVNSNQINNLIDAVFAVAHGIHSAIKSGKYSFSSIPYVTPKEIVNAMKKVNFTTIRNQNFAFDSLGNPAYVSYSIEKIQYDKSTKRFEYLPIGQWYQLGKQRLIIDAKLINTSDIHRSSCSVDCVPGQRVIGKKSCCWLCETCSSSSISTTINAESCTKCPDRYHTIDNKECIKTPFVYMDYKHPIGITSLVLGLLGGVLIVVVLAAGWYRRTSPVIIECSHNFMLISICLLVFTFSCISLHVIQPTQFICKLRDVYFHAILVLYSGLLLAKNKSVSRFISKFVNQKKNVYVSQIFLFILVIIIQAALVTAWMFIDNTPTELIFSKYEYLVHCKIQFTILRIVAIVFPFVVLLTTTIQTVPDRNMNYKHGEPKFLTFTCLAMCIISAAYIITVNQVVGVFQDMVIIFTAIGYGYAYIACMMLPRLYVAYTTVETENKEGVDNEGYQSNDYQDNPDNTVQQREITLKRYDAKM